MQLSWLRLSFHVEGESEQALGDAQKEKKTSLQVLPKILHIWLLIQSKPAILSINIL